MPPRPQPAKEPFFQEIYIDETSRSGSHRFLVIGGIIIPKHLAEAFESDIMKARMPRLAARFDSKMRLLPATDRRCSL
jgi:hypothetical protein